MKRGKLILTALFLFTLVACERTVIFGSHQHGGRVGVSVSGTEYQSVKSSGPQDAELLFSRLVEDVDGQDLILEAYVSDYPGLLFSYDTKGSVVTGDGTDGTQSINSTGMKFSFNGWLGSYNRYPNGRTYEEGGSDGRNNHEEDETNYHFISNAIATKGSKEWALDRTSNWRNGVPSTFWSWYPDSIDKDADTGTMVIPSDTASDEEQSEIEFFFKLPQKAEDHKDILFAYNLHTVTYDDKGKTDDDEVVDIHFYHALAAIRFDISGAIKNNVDIVEVFFKNIFINGSCVISGTKNGMSTSPGLVQFDWHTSGEEGEVGEIFDRADFSEKGLDGTTANALMPIGSDKFFFMIPQSVNGGVEIGIKYRREDGSTHTKTVELNHVPWQPGKIYTYRLNPAADFVAVDILETLDRTSKADVSIKNTGNVYEYLRAAIVGNWVASDGTNETLMAPWTFDASEFSGINVGTDMGWTLASDGFFYSNTKIEPGASLTLFDSYTASGSPSASATLNLYILSQAIAAGDTEDWNSAMVAVKSAPLTRSNNNR